MTPVKRPKKSDHLFGRREDREKLHDAALRYCQHLHNQGIRIVIVNGTSAKHAMRLLVMPHWKQLYRNEPKPAIVYISTSDLWQDRAQNTLVNNHPKIVEALQRGEKASVFIDFHISKYDFFGINRALLLLDIKTAERAALVAEHGRVKSSNLQFAAAERFFPHPFHPEEYWGSRQLELEKSEYKRKKYFGHEVNLETLKKAIERKRKVRALHKKAEHRRKTYVRKTHKKGH